MKRILFIVIALILLATSYGYPRIFKGDNSFQGRYWIKLGEESTGYGRYQEPFARLYYYEPESVRCSDDEIWTATVMWQYVGYETTWGLKQEDYATKKFGMPVYTCVYTLKFFLRGRGQWSIPTRGEKAMVRFYNRKGDLLSEFKNKAGENHEFLMENSIYERLAEILTKKTCSKKYKDDD